MMRQNDPPTVLSSSLTLHDSEFNTGHQDGHQQAAPVPQSSSSSSSHLAPSVAITASFSQHDSPQWTATSSLTSILAEGDSSHDHEMTDLDAEDGGAPLTDTDLSAYLHDDGIISPFTGSVMETTLFYDSVADDDELDHSINLDADPEMSHAAMNPALDSDPDPSASAPAPPLPTTPTMVQNGTQLPLFAQQALSAVAPQLQPQQLLQHQQQLLLHQQMQQQMWNEVLEDELAMMLHPQSLNNPNPMSLGPDNMGFAEFLRAWARIGRTREARPAPRIDRLIEQFTKEPPLRVEYADLQGDKYDFQGIDWEDLGVPRKKARERRRETYNNYVNKPGSDKWHPALPDMIPPSCENYYRFRNMNLRRDTRLLHFQLRNTLGCASRTRVFYPSAGAIRELDPTTGRTRKAMNFRSNNGVQISTLTVDEDILVAGGFVGDYRYRNVDSEDVSYIRGKLTDNPSGITNHIQVHSARRSGVPVAAFASNDFGFRALDLTTNKILFEAMYGYPLNCTAISTDRRLRVMVGDHSNVLIADAESGEILQELSGHRDFGFACDWAPDGWTVATGFQDKSVSIWDARKWKSTSTGKGCPVAVLRMDMSGARSLRFSPLGSGKRVLVAAEEADLINIIDARTFDTKQRLEVFGEIGGTAFADEGQNLMTLICDSARGGIVQFDRCDAGAEDSFDYARSDLGSRNRPWWASTGYDWADIPGAGLSQSKSMVSTTRRRRKTAAMGNINPF